MSTARSLRRRIDPDLVARMLNNIPRPVEPLKHQKPPRHASTYRGARRNATIHRGKQ
jgi:hypothetical protein